MTANLDMSDSTSDFSGTGGIPARRRFIPGAASRAVPWKGVIWRAIVLCCLVAVVLTDGLRSSLMDSGAQGSFTEKPKEPSVYEPSRQYGVYLTR